MLLWWWWLRCYDGAGCGGCYGVCEAGGATSVAGGEVQDMRQDKRRTKEELEAAKRRAEVAEEEAAAKRWCDGGL